MLPSVEIVVIESNWILWSFVYILSICSWGDVFRFIYKKKFLNHPVLNAVKIKQFSWITFKRALWLVPRICNIILFFIYFYNFVSISFALFISWADQTNFLQVFIFFLFSCCFWCHTLYKFVDRKIYLHVFIYEVDLLKQYQNSSAITFSW